MTRVSDAQSAGSPGVEHNTQAFLEALAAGGGKPLEQLSPQETRAVLVNAQASVTLDFPGCEISGKTITGDGQTITLTVVRPAGMTTTLSVFIWLWLATASAATWRPSSA